MQYGQNPYAPPQPHGQNPFAPGNGNPYGPGPQDQAPFNSAPHGQNPFAPQYGQQPAAGHMPGAGGSCSYCGGFPAVKATVRGHQGFLIVMRFLRRSGNFCRSCGIATHREMTTKTLWQGWWGFLSFVITPITLLINLVARGKFNKLPHPSGGVRPPLDPGKPIFGRVGAYGILVPVILVAVLVAAAAVPDHAAHTAQAGDCVSKSGTDDDPIVSVVDCTSTSAQFKVDKRVDGIHSGDACSREYAEYDESGTGDDFSLCLTPLH